MTGPPTTRRDSKTTFREVEKQARAFESGGAVRVFGENGYFITLLNSLGDADKIHLLLDARNAVPVRSHGGKLLAIKLLSFGDDRGHSGERHGTSIITTERIVNDRGVYVGSDRNLKHKAENVNHGRPKAGQRAAKLGGPLKPPPAT